MNVALRKPWTVERFLAWEDRQEGRHEFDGTRIHEMTGGSRAHQRIVSNLVRMLEDALDPDRFDAVPEMRLDVGGKVRYPDVSVVSGRIADAVRTLHDALVLFEVLSDETASIDRTEKRDEYACLACGATCCWNRSGWQQPCLSAPKVAGWRLGCVRGRWTCLSWASTFPSPRSTGVSGSGKGVSEASVA